MGDLFTGIASHEGRGVGLGLVNVGFQAFHEGRGAGKTDPLRGSDLVNRKKRVTGMKIARKSMLMLDQQRCVRGRRLNPASLKCWSNAKASVIFNGCISWTLVQ